MIGCNYPYASFQEGEKTIYVCGQDSKGIITDIPCNERSEDFLELQRRGLNGGMRIYVDLCEDSYDVIAFGEFETIGNPKFEFSIYSWGQFISQRDSLDSIYSNDDCKHIYSE